MKVTVLATGFGMKNIPGIEPEVKAIEEELNAITRQQQEEIAKEERKLNQMVNALYKPDYKMYVFKGEEMYNEEFLAALDNSPTYRRTAQDLERMVSIFGDYTTVPTNAPLATADADAIDENIVEEVADDENPGETVFNKEMNEME